MMVVRSCTKSSRAPACQALFQRPTCPSDMLPCIAIHVAWEGLFMVQTVAHACAAISMARMYRPVSHVQTLLPCPHGFERLHISRKHMQPGARALARRSSACCTMRSLALSSALVACAPAWRSCTPMQHCNELNWHWGRASSSSSTSGFLRMARAMAMRCF